MNTWTNYSALLWGALTSRTKWEQYPSFFRYSNNPNTVGFNMEAIAIAVAVGLAAAVLGILVGRYLLPAARSADQVALSVAQADAKRLSDEIGVLNARADNLQSDLQRKSDALQEEEKKSARLDERASTLAKQLDEQGQGRNKASG